MVGGGGGGGSNDWAGDGGTGFVEICLHYSTPPLSLPNEEGALDEDGDELIPVKDWYSDYSRTLCRVLNPCGDGDEPFCMENEAQSSIQRAECEDLGCCDVEGVPADKKRRKR